MPAKLLLLHSEIAQQTTKHVTQEAQPILYNLVKKLCSKAGVTMPRYISIFTTAYNVVDKYGTVQTANQPINAYVDALGDLYICRELLTDLSYNQIKGILAVAIAEKAENRPVQTAALGFGVFGLTAGSVIYANKKYQLNLGSFMFERHRSCREENGFDSARAVMMAPSLITCSIFYNHLQKKIDLKAAQLTKPQHVIDGITAIEKIQDAYYKEDIFSRAAAALHLTSIANTLLYPVRAYTSAERIAYLEKISDTQA